MTYPQAMGDVASRHVRDHNPPATGMSLVCDSPPTWAEYHWTARTSARTVVGDDVTGDRDPEPRRRSPHRRGLSRGPPAGFRRARPRAGPGCQGRTGRAG